MLPVAGYNISNYFIRKEAEADERARSARRYSREEEKVKIIRAVLEQFKKEFIPSAPVEECIICLNSINEEYIKLECEHSYHKDCIEQWALVNPSCAVCRKKY